MRLLTFAALATLLLAPLPARAADAFTFPAGCAGGHAQAWFAAYAAGDDAIGAFWRAHASAASLAERPAEARVAFTARVRGDMGALTPVSVTATGDDECTVLARAEKGGGARIGFRCDAEHMLGGIRVEPTDDVPAGPAGSGGVPAGATPPPAPPAAVGPPPTDAQIVAALNAAIDSLARIGEFSGDALLEKDGQPLLLRATGMASRVGREHNTPDTRFNLGSLNKIITHVAIEQLAQAGKLTLDDPVTRWLPDYAVANANKVTLRMLLAHKGGVPDMFGNPRYREARKHTRTMADWYALVREMPLEFEPGTRQAYSNGGFVLLGRVIEAASHEDYYDYVRTHVYAPAGMTRTEHLASDARAPRTATGYTERGGARTDAIGADTLGGVMPNDGELPARGSSAGGGYSTVGDLARFATALRAGKLLDAAHVRDVFGEHFSLGIAGGSPGVNGLFLVAGPYTLVVLANQDPPAAERFAQTIGRMVRRAAGLPPPPARGASPQ